MVEGLSFAVIKDPFALWCAQVSTLLSAFSDSTQVRRP
jgi:hypothetical protein